MANYILNKIIVLDGDPEEFFTAVGDGRTMDFGKIIATPPDYDLWERRSARELPPRYDWNSKNWRTPFNAMKSARRGSCIWFRTAWSVPWPVIEKLSARFPYHTLSFLAFDEDRDIVAEARIVGGCLYRLD